MSIGDVRGELHAIGTRVEEIPGENMGATREGLMELRRTLAALSASTSEVSGRVGGLDGTFDQITASSLTTSEKLSAESAAIDNVTSTTSNQTYADLRGRLNMMASGVILTEMMGAYRAKVEEVAGALATAAAAFESLEGMAGRDVTANERQQGMVTQIGADIHTAANSN